MCRYSPLALHLTQTHVDLDLFFGKQGLLHVCFDSTKEERTQHLRSDEAFKRVLCPNKTFETIRSVLDIQNLQCEDARPTSGHPSSCLCQTMNQNPTKEIKKLISNKVHELLLGDRVDNRTV